MNRNLMLGAAAAMAIGMSMTGDAMGGFRHPSVAPTKKNKRKRQFKGSKAAKKAARRHRT